MVDPAMNEAMAESALWAVLSLQRDCFDYAAQQRAARWAQHAQRAACDLPVSVLGLGQMGGTVARRLALNGYPVTGWSARPAALPGVRCLAGAEALPQALSQAQVLVNLLPLTAATRGLVDAALLAGRTWSRPTCSRRWTAATFATRCSTSSRPSRCRRRTRSGAIRA
jgi:glyoxylate/hydroxypyruvate reductase A